jgi:hypothetical protein
MFTLYIAHAKYTTSHVLCDSLFGSEMAPGIPHKDHHIKPPAQTINQPSVENARATKQNK